MPYSITAETDRSRQSLTTGPYTITYTLMAINIVVFAAMVMSGVSFSAPTPLDAFHWGADYGPATIGQGQ